MLVYQIYKVDNNYEVLIMVYDNEKYLKSQKSHIEQLNELLQDDEASSQRKEIWKEQLEFIENNLIRYEEIKIIVKDWERQNGKIFNASVIDAKEYEDVVDLCNDLNMSVIKAIREIYLPIGSTFKPYDLREYIYLPLDYIEDKE